MKTELLLLIRKHTDILIEQTKAQETLKFRMNNQLKTFLFNSSIYLSEEGKW